MATDKSLTGSEGVRKFQTMLHAKAKEEPKKEQVRRNGGSAGVEALQGHRMGSPGELARDLREGRTEA